MLSRSSNCILNSRLFLSIPSPYITVRYKNVLPYQETKFHLPNKRSACIIKHSIRSTLLLTYAKFNDKSYVTYRSKKPCYFKSYHIVIESTILILSTPRSISNASTREKIDETHPWSILSTGPPGPIMAGCPGPIGPVIG